MRVFVAVGVGDELRRAAIAVRRSVESQFSALAIEPPRLIWVVPSSLHVTLRFVGEWPDERGGALAAALGNPFDVAPFTLAWHGLGAFPSTRRPRAIWMGVARGARGLGALEAEVARRMGSLVPGEDPAAAAPFHPHVTIARVKVDNPKVDWPATLAAASPADVITRVERVSLMRSRGLAGGEGYEELAGGWLVGRS
ncbi:MAG TPA: RNA 2',3'-cyclic phosphodiesterase [Vicinamibacterales bacterium]|mgnify:CR=1 FL=1|nr:RNA 2',3'-cyclic phosphodiesterase [Vicinamibacterales bacterium]